MFNDRITRILNRLVLVATRTGFGECGPRNGSPLLKPRSISKATSQPGYMMQLPDTYLGGAYTNGSITYQHNR